MQHHRRSRSVTGHHGLAMLASCLAVRKNRRFPRLPLLRKLQPLAASPRCPSHHRLLQRLHCVSNLHRWWELQSPACFYIFSLPLWHRYAHVQINSTTITMRDFRPVSLVAIYSASAHLSHLPCNVPWYHVRTDPLENPLFFPHRDSSSKHHGGQIKVNCIFLSIVSLIEVFWCHTHIYLAQ